MDDWGPALHAHYQRLRVLGHGAFGEVVLAQERAGGRRVAVKRVFSRPARVGGAAASNSGAREAAALAALRGSPHVVQLLGVHEEAGTTHLVLELCAADLFRLLAACYAPLPPATVKGIMQQLLAGLAAAHAAGYMHRDVKPGNTLISFDGLIKLSDWGLARRLEGRRDSCGGCAGQRAGDGASGGAAPGAGQAGAAGSSAAAGGSSSSGGCYGGMLPGSGEGGQASSSGIGQGAAGGAYSAAVATRWYRAPELLYGSTSYDASVDVWAAGAVFAELLGLGPLLAGESDIGQLALMQQRLGPITPREWPEVVALPDWGKVQFHAEGAGGAGEAEAGEAAPASSSATGSSGGGGGGGVSGASRRGGAAGSSGGAESECAHKQLVGRLAALLPGAPGDALDLLAQLLRYPPYRRPSAAGALRHPYFATAAPPPAGSPEVAAFAAGALSRHTRVQAGLAALGA